MEKKEYLAWLTQNGIYKKRKYQTDSASRAKKVEDAFFASFPDFKGFDAEFEKDKGARVLRMVSKRGSNAEMSATPVKGLPLGTNQMDSLSSAVKKYFEFLASTNG